MRHLGLSLILSYQTRFFHWHFCCPNPTRFLFRIARSCRLDESYQLFFAMALRCFPIWVCPQTAYYHYPLLGFDTKRRRICLWECSSSASQRAITAVGGDVPYGRELKKPSDEMGLTQERPQLETFHRDLSMLPSESYSSPFSCCFMTFTWKRWDWLCLTCYNPIRKL